jgi:hypothetical protein
VKKIISLCLTFLAILWFAMLINSCTPVRHYVNVKSHKNYYQKHRRTTYTVPVFIPGQGIVLETKTVHKVKKH